MPLAYYKCAKCKHIFDSYKEALECENSHPIPVEVRVKTYTIRPYPYAVEVTFSDGVKKVYNDENMSEYGK